MSLYNMLHGRNPLAPVMLGWLGLTEADCGRFRDVFVTKAEDGEPRVHVYTRNGGGNRECFCETDTQHNSGEGYCTPRYTAALQEHRMYESDSDDDFDCTYATFVFHVPEPWRDAALALIDDAPTPAEKWERILAKLKSADTTDPEVRRVVDAAAPVVDAIRKALDIT